MGQRHWGASRKRPDFSQLEPAKPAPATPARPSYEETARVAATLCAQLLKQFGDLFERYDLRHVEIDALLRGVRDTLPDMKLRSLLIEAVVRPLSALCAKFQEADRELAAARDVEISGIYRDHVVSEGGRYVDKMFRTFERTLTARRAMDEYFAADEGALKDLHTHVAQGVQQAATVREALSREAETLNLLVADTHRRAEQGGYKRSTDEVVRARITELEEGKRRFQAVFVERYRPLQDAYRQDVKTRELLGEQVDDHEQTQRTLVEALRAFGLCFVRAEISPSVALGIADEELDRLLRDEAPLERCRALLNTPLGSFPEFREERGADLLERAQAMVERLQRILEKRAGRGGPPVVKTAAVPPGAPPLSVVTTETTPETPPEGGIVTPLHIVVCAFASFCRQTKAGAPYPMSGRTVRKVLDILAVENLCFGFSETALLKAVNTAEEHKLLQPFVVGVGSRRRTCHQPTGKGFAIAHEWFSAFPPETNFRTVVAARIEQLRQEQARFREQRKKRLGGSGA